MLVTLSVLFSLVLQSLSLVEHLLLIVVSQELILEGSGALLLVILLLSNFISYTVQELLVSGNLVSTVLLTIYHVSAHLA